MKVSIHHEPGGLHSITFNPHCPLHHHDHPR